MLAAVPAKTAATKSSKATAKKKAASTTAKKTTTATAKKTSGTAAKKRATTTKKSTSRRRRYARRRAPVVTAAVRNAAIVEVNDALNVGLALNGSFEPFDNSSALVPFFERLYRLKNDSGPAVHVLHYGDSHSASDDWPSVLRQAFQTQFGDGGPGFVLPGRPFPGYRRYDAAGTNSRGWISEGTMKRRGDGMHGLSGISLNTKRAGETITLSATGEQAELYLLQQPGGGNLDIWLDDAYQGTVATDGELKPIFTSLPGASGPRRYMFRTSTAEPVRLFGSVIQNARGVTWETLGINGAVASIVADWDENILRAHLAARDPAMIVLAYGTNEATNRRWDPNAYESALRSVVMRLRSHAPAATILLVGPPDFRVRSPFALTQIVEIQRRVAYDLNCAFWSWRDRMGGPGAIRNWVFAGFAQGDMIHMNRTGYQLVGRTMFQDLMHVYERFLGARTEATSVAAREDQ
jgi:lysophospholipase L1-like esterase